MPVIISPLAIYSTFYSHSTIFVPKIVVTRLDCLSFDQQLVMLWSCFKLQVEKDSENYLVHRMEIDFITTMSIFFQKHIKHSQTWEKLKQSPWENHRDVDLYF